LIVRVSAGSTQVCDASLQDGFAESELHAEALMVSDAMV